MAKKQLSVPSSGTTPMGTPLDNMFSNLAAQSADTEAKAADLPKDEAAELPKATKKRTSINLDESIYTEFKVYCVKNGKSISGLLEQAMVDIMNGR